VRRIPVRGVISHALKERVEYQIRLALSANAGVIVFQLECGDGEADAAFKLGQSISQINDGRQRPVETIAYVTIQSRNTAAFLALACDRIVIQPDPSADRGPDQKALYGLGRDFDRFEDANPGKAKEMADGLVKLAREHGHPEALARALVLKEEPLYWATLNTG